MTNIGVAIFLALIGCYAFQIVAWRSINNHVYSKLDKLTRKVDKLIVDVADRLARIETMLETKKKE